MAQNTIHEARLAYFRETTVCEPPADWAASGTPIEFVSFDTSGIKQEHLDDPTAEARFFAVGARRKIKAIATAAPRSCSSSTVPALSPRTLTRWCRPRSAT